MSGSIEYLLTQKIGIQDWEKYANDSNRLDLGNKMGWTDYIDFIGPEDMSYPVMWGYDKYNRSFLCIKYTVNYTDRKEKKEQVDTIFKRYSNADNDVFCNGTRYLDPLFPLRYMDDSYWSIVKELLTTGKCKHHRRSNVTITH